MGVDIDNVVLSGAEADFFGIFGDMGSVEAVDPLLEGLGIITGRIRMLEDEVQAGLVQRNWVGGC